MADKEKPIEINYDIVDNATDAQVSALCRQYSRGDKDAIKAVNLYYEAAKRGDASSIRLMERFNQIAENKNKEFLKGIREGDPKTVENTNRIIENFNKGILTPGEKDFLLDYVSPAEEDIDFFISGIISNPAAVDDFLEGLTPGKIKKLIPSHEVTPQEKEALSYTREELKTLQTGSEEEKAQVKAARRERAKRFLSDLTLGEFITITKKGKPRRKKAPSKEIPSGTAISVDEYVTTKDILSKAVFGEPGRNGKKASLVRKNPGFLTLWTTGKGKNKKEVTVYTRLDPDEKALEAAGVTIGRNLSQCAREIFGALLSHRLAGNSLLSLGMVGKIIFNVRNGNDLTEAQKKYIVDGAREIFATSLFVDTTQVKTDKEGNREENYMTLQEAQSVNINRLEQVFPGRITSAYINGNLVETAIELFELPTLYRLQNALEKGQILRAPIELLEIPGRMDEDVVTIRAYLLRRIDAMKHSNLSRMIIYKNILDEVGVDPTDRAQKDRKSRVLKKVERVLDYWKEEGYIHDYAKLAKDGKPAKGTASIYEIEIRL